ncbi:selenocysteine lyase/cysteine desulfurase [Shinella sp. BE166]
MNPQKTAHRPHGKLQAMQGNERVLLGAIHYDLRPDARRFETWENNYAARLGFGVAIDYAQAIGTDVIMERCRSLADQLREPLPGFPA